jgi:hypothetical protein
MSKFTVDVLESMFMYLGCANIATQEAMDGAIPLETLSQSGNEVVAEFDAKKLETTALNWSTKVVWFSGDRLSLSTASNVHWSEIQMPLQKQLNRMRANGEYHRTLSEIDGFMRVHYSEIDQHGKFVKFEVSPKPYGDVIVNRVFNPFWTFAFVEKSMFVIGSLNDRIYDEKQISFLPTTIGGLGQSLGCYWQVLTKFDEVCPSLTMLTDPTGVKEFWKLRDIPAGKKRRDALLHWVNDHWRKKRNDPDVEHYVRKHLRGSESITYKSFSAKIIPSEKDRLDIEIAKAERKAMRDKKTDLRNRKKVLAKKA